MQFADRQEKWGYILANIGRMELQDLSQEDDVFRSVFEDSMHQKQTNMEKEEYKKSVLEYEDVQKAVRYAEKLGREQGRKEGVEQCIKEGIEQGREERTRQIVRNMLAKGFDPDLVAEISGLTAEEVRAMSAEAE
jgi:predicted transposase/invertase (TIGR01784 family)